MKIHIPLDQSIVIITDLLHYSDLTFNQGIQMEFYLRIKKENRELDDSWHRVVLLFVRSQGGIGPVPVRLPTVLWKSRKAYSSGGMLTDPTPWEVVSHLDAGFEMKLAQRFEEEFVRIAKVSNLEWPLKQDEEPVLSFSPDGAPRVIDFIHGIRLGLDYKTATVSFRV